MISIKNRKRDKIDLCDIFVHRGYPLGNPFLCEPFGPYTRDECIAKYKVWLYEKIQESDPAVVGALEEIRKKYLTNQDFALVCYCPTLKCHASIIKEYIEKETL